MDFIFFNIMDIVFPLFFLLFFVVFVAIFIKGLAQWNKNNHSPRLTVPVTVVGRRTHRSSGAGEHHHHHTSYYITFQVESGDRMELNVPSTEYGYIVEGDRGNLTFQGTRFVSFERT